MNIEVIRNIDELKLFEPKWNSAVRYSNFDSVFVTYEWWHSWLKNFGKGKDFYIVVASDKEKLLGMIPLLRERKNILGLNLTILRSIANVHTSYYKYDFIMNGNPEVLKNMLDFICSDKRWDLIQLDYLPLDSETPAMLNKLEGNRFYKMRTLHQAKSMYVDMNGDWEGYLKRLDKKVRRNLNYYEERLHKEGNADIQVISGCDDLERHLADAFEIEKKSWKGDIGTAIASSDDTKNFYVDLAKSADKQGWFELYFLSFNGERIAFDYCLKYRDRFNVLKTGYDPKYSKNSPGRVLRKKTLRNLFSDKTCKVYDFLGTEDKWKMEWTSDSQALLQIFVFNKKVKAKLIYNYIILRDSLKPHIKSNKFLSKLFGRNLAAPSLAATGGGTAPRSSSSAGDE